MSAFEVLQRFGTTALLKFAAAVVVFLLLHLLRIPLVVLARVLEVSMRRLDGYATKQASKPPTGPINQFFRPTNAFREESSNVHA
ncbi:hypothetical protein SAMN05421835_110176 [Amycolatopsis sacchari]|uniref:Uncharacterized protein n=1 Tax=Amycolatopsis sacchari TaxID=115433 RepID=A0A1I3VAI6_9PSEU|nr:hypothetical protein [Amycolatopsis sacchari]SFJ91151.1 hypothetical protein SAMN05421835_110176 [Amycolatopsis sacchari]